MGNVDCESQPNPIKILNYDYFTHGTFGDFTIAVEGKTIRANKSILSTSSEYFENFLKDCNHVVPIIVPSGIKFIDLCYVLDFAYRGQVQVPQGHLDDFIKTGEILRIRGFKESRIHFMQNSARIVLSTSVNSSFDVLKSSTQETLTEQLPSKRPRKENDPSIQETFDKMKKVLENVPQFNVEQIQLKSTAIELHHMMSEFRLSPKPFPTQKRQSAPAALLVALGEKRIKIEPPKFNRQGHKKHCKDNPVCHLTMPPTLLPRYNSSMKEPLKLVLKRHLSMPLLTLTSLDELININMGRKQELVVLHINFSFISTVIKKVLT